MSKENKCSKCGKAFESERGLHIHQSQVHGEIIDNSQNRQKNSLIKFIRGKSVSTRNILLTGIIIGLILGATITFLAIDPDESDKEYTEMDKTTNQSMDSTRSWAYEIEKANSPKLGPENASIEIIVYQDYACEECKKLEYSNESPLKQIQEKYVESGDAQIVWKSFPSNSKNWSIEAAIGMKCVHRYAPESFFKVKKGIFNHQEEVNRNNIISKITVKMNTTNEEKNKVKKCIENRETEKEVLEEKRLGDKLGVYIAPAIIVDDDIEKSYWHLNGLKNYEEYSSTIELAKASNRQRK